MYYKVVRNTDKTVLFVTENIIFGKRQGRVNKIAHSVDEADYIFSPDMKYRYYPIGNKIKKPNCGLEEVDVISITKKEFETFGCTEVENRIETLDVKNPIELAKQATINELNKACEAAIVGGFDINLESGEVKHIDLTLQDQINMLAITSQMAVLPKETYTFHFKGEADSLISDAIMKSIIFRSNNWKNYYLSYFNALKNYVNSLSDISKIAEVKFGMEIPAAFCSPSYLEAKELFDHDIGRVLVNE